MNDLISAKAILPNLRAASKKQVLQELARKAAERKDHAAVLKHSKDFLETSGLAHAGELIGWAFDSSFAITNNFDNVAASIEKYLARLPHTSNPSVTYVENASKEWTKGGKQATRPVEGKKLAELLAKVSPKANEAQKHFAAIGTARAANNAKRIGDTAAAAVPSLPAGSQFQLQAGLIAVEALTSANQFDKAGEIAKKVAESHKGNTHLLWAGAQAYLRLAKPKSADAIPLLREIVQAGYAPLDPASVRSALFQACEANGMVAEAQAEMAEIRKLSPGSIGNRDLERRLAVLLATAGKTNEATQIYQKLAKEAKPYNGDLPIVAELAAVTTADATWMNAVFDDYLKRPNRGPNQVIALNAKGRITQMVLTNSPAAEKILRDQAERSADFLFAYRGPTVDWMEQLQLQQSMHPLGWCLCSR